MPMFPSSPTLEHDKNTTPFLIVLLGVARATSIMPLALQPASAPSPQNVMWYLRNQHDTPLQLQRYNAYDVYQLSYLYAKNKIILFFPTYPPVLFCSSLFSNDSAVHGLNKNLV
ncbi:hypothetical protein B0T09DRAFT_112131 [Sordaria sp. MPI-SDFR-AT-0083]|nr:hypothetical protein B0T09DRAFT_112131 [Sordaria sp. MPI-SDFR-AT-0083]